MPDHVCTRSTCPDWTGCERCEACSPPARLVQCERCGEHFCQPCWVKHECGSET
jgi:hypothetical protein